MSRLVYFLTSRSGYVQPREGLSLGWLVLVVLALSVLVGTTEPVHADKNPYYCCAYLGPNDGDNVWCCSPDGCVGGWYWRYRVWRVGGVCHHYGEEACSCF